MRIKSVLAARSGTTPRPGRPSSHVGKLDKALDEARAGGWTVVSMKDDWKAIFSK